MSAWPPMARAGSLTMTANLLNIDCHRVPGRLPGNRLPQAAADLRPAAAGPRGTAHRACRSPTQDRLLAEDIETAAQVVRTPAVQSLRGSLLPSLQ